MQTGRQHNCFDTFPFTLPLRIDRPVSAGCCADAVAAVVAGAAAAAAEGVGASQWVRPHACAHPL